MGKKSRISNKEQRRMVKRNLCTCMTAQMKPKALAVGNLKWMDCENCGKLIGTEEEYLMGSPRMMVAYQKWVKEARSEFVSEVITTAKQKSNCQMISNALVRGYNKTKKEFSNETINLDLSK